MDVAIVGQSRAIREVLSRVGEAARMDYPVLVTGESGTGKELVARAIHQSGSRRANPFVAVNCSAIPDPLVEAELFGHTKGAYTGADRDRQGLFASANRGTLFLDEIADMSQKMQATLLRVLEEKEVRPVGGEKLAKVDVRIISATNRNPKELIAQGIFRDDLYFRLAIFRIKTPPLRDRREDIPSLVEHFLSATARETGTRPKKISPQVLDTMTSYDWPGNVRELENEIRRLISLCFESDVISRWQEPSRVVLEGGAGAASCSSGSSLKDAVEEFEKHFVAQALRETGGNVSAAAKKLAMSRYGLIKKMEKLGIARHP